MPWTFYDKFGQKRAAATGSGSGMEVAYAEFTGAVTTSATTEATANTVVTGTAFTADGTSAYLIEFFGPVVTTGGGSGSIDFWLYDGASSIGRLGTLVNNAAGSMAAPIRLSRRLTPANASKTYSVRASSSGGSGTVTGGAGGTATILPGYIRITKI